MSFYSLIIISFKTIPLVTEKTKKKKKGRGNGINFSIFKPYIVQFLEGKKKSSTRTNSFIGRSELGISISSHFYAISRQANGEVMFAHFFLPFFIFFPKVLRSASDKSFDEDGFSVGTMIFL